MIDAIWTDIISELQNNDFLKGGVVMGGLMALWQYCKQIPSLIHKLYYRYCTLSISIAQGKEMFLNVAQAIYEAHKKSNSGAFISGGQFISIDGMEDPEDETSKDKIGFLQKCGNLLIPFGTRYHWDRFCLIQSSITERKLENASPDSASTHEIEVTFFGFGKKAALNRLTEVGKKKRKTRQLRVKSNEREYWQYGNPLRTRNKNQIVTKFTDEIISDLTTFIASGDWYNDRGIPFRRGILLYGPPGTGKSSLAQVIATELSMDLNVLTLASTSPSALSGLMGASNQLILIEDIDVATEAAENRKLESSKAKDKSSVKITLSDLLNSIDGVCSGWGNILIITTNDKSRIDPALLRPGRIDKSYEIGYLDKETFDRLCMLYYGKTCDFPVTNTLTAAEVQGVFIQNPTSIEDFEDSLWTIYSQNVSEMKVSLSGAT